MGGRINNRVKASEMFVIVPARWADNLIELIGDTPDVKGIYEATRPEESAYWERQKDKAQRAVDDPDARLAKEKYGLEISMAWEDEALQAILKAPKFVRKMAVGNVEEFAEEQGVERISIATVKAQADQVGMGKFMSDVSAKPGGLLKRLFRKR